jgi:hypothetical protein
VTDFHELDSFIPMLPNGHLTENMHSDTKGGGPNGRVNGLVKMNGMRGNGRVKAAYLLMAADVPDDAHVSRDASGSARTYACLCQVPLQRTQQSSLQRQNMSSTCSDYSSAAGRVCSLEEIDQSLNSDDLIVTDEGSSCTEMDHAVAAVPQESGEGLREEEVLQEDELATSAPLLSSSSAHQQAALVERQSSSKPQDKLHLRV